MISWLSVTVLLATAAITTSTPTNTSQISKLTRAAQEAALSRHPQQPSASQELELNAKVLESSYEDEARGRKKDNYFLVGRQSEAFLGEERNERNNLKIPLATTTTTSGQPTIYTNQFVIEVKGGESEARKLAEKHGFAYLNHILGDYYHLEHRRLAKRSTSQDALNISIQDEPQVILLERQVLKKRVKRDFLEASEFPVSRLVSVSGSTSVGVTASSISTSTRNNNIRPPQRSSGGSNSMSAANPQLQYIQHHFLRPAHTEPKRPHHSHYTRPANQQPARPPANDPLETAASSASATLYRQPLPPPARTLNILLNNNSSNTGNSLATTQETQSAGNATLQARSRQQQQQQQQLFNDPSWPLMWYLDGGAKNGFDLNVKAAWKMGYTGKGIVITILDDGLEKDHPDLQANYDPLASFDINGDDADPMPRYDANDSNRHGTRCAGEVAAVPDNNICSIGIAYNSKVGGVRMLDGDVTDAVEARSLGLNNQHIDIYSASWGPDDNGKTVDGPGELATRAFIDGVTNGRSGLGSIFVFASGNGGREHDNCNCDGYTNSIWTLSISSATENGFVPWYIEACSSTLATTYSSGSYEERQIATTDLHHSCTSSHTGTSASAPLAAGICALVLESNPKLTWRDMQHIVVRTSKPANLLAKDWRTNAMGRNVSHAFGYGLMNAAAMILMAKQWTTVPPQYTCQVEAPKMEKFIPAKGYIELKLRADCINVRHLEHVQSKVTLTASRRGDLHIYLVSPQGTRSTLLAQRPNDQAEQGFKNWPFMTVHSWGESPNGVWTLEVHNDGKPQNRAFLKEWTLILYGTYEDPNRHLDGGGGGFLTSGPNSPTSFRQPISILPKPLPPISTSSPVQTNHPDTTQPKSPVTLRPHWSTFNQPPPPPVSPTSSSSRPTTTITTQSPPSTTTQSSYVTTFKTIVSQSSSSSSSSSSNKNLPKEQQPAQLNGSGSRLQVNMSEGEKSDFEIVAAPNPSINSDSTTKQLNSSFGGGSSSSVQQFNLTSGVNLNNPSLSSKGNPIELDPSSILFQSANGFGTNLGNSQAAQDMPTVDLTSKTPVSQVDGNKIDAMPTTTTTAASPNLFVDMHQQQTSNTQQQQQQDQVQSIMTSTLGSIPKTLNNTIELDSSNQLDSKQTKDYRSSGDQSVYLAGPETILINQQQRQQQHLDSNGKIISVLKHPNSAQGGGNFGPMLVWLPLVASLLLLNHRFGLIRGRGKQIVIY